MSTETVRYHHAEDEEGDIIRLDSEPKDREIGTYRPGRRAMATMAMSAAAGELARVIRDTIATGARPDNTPHPRRDEEDPLPEEPFAKAA
jgi:hypothetical protein